ncbi:MAG: hypothetical protein M3Y03_07210, partial [Verrucomicrobiota bacterium]|nr:hypothetical protein [Verrucomicrobiota bacterium]
MNPIACTSTCTDANLPTMRARWSARRIMGAVSSFSSGVEVGPKKRMKAARGGIITGGGALVKQNKGRDTTVRSARANNDIVTDPLSARFRLMPNRCRPGFRALTCVIAAALFWPAPAKAVILYATGDATANTSN